MPARDYYHDHVRNALIKDGWTITHDPLKLKWGSKDMCVDLGAEQLLAAEKDARKIAVEVKSFLGPSEMSNLEQALGQYVLYTDVLSEVEPERILYLAVSRETFDDIFEEPIGKLLIEKRHLHLLVFDIITEAIHLWIPRAPIAS